jgi:hypothetical protein
MLRLKEMILQLVMKRFLVDTNQLQGSSYEWHLVGVNVLL